MKGFLGFGKKSKKTVNNTHFELCSCKSEILVLEYDPEIGLMDCAIYHHGVSIEHKMSWYQKLRYVWQVLINNKPYADQIVFDRTQIQNLKVFLDGCI